MDQVRANVINPPRSFPPHIADQLALLQDKVAPFDGKLAKQQIEAAMGGLPVEAWFDDFEIKPLASASIAQVHTARLKSNGKEVVIKVIRPDILPVIKADLKLIYRLASLGAAFAAGWSPSAPNRSGARVRKDLD